MKILVTGAEGYLGQGIVRALARDGIDIIATDIKKIDTEPSYEYIDADLFSIEDPYVFFNKPDCILHLAWRDGFKHDSDYHINDLANHYNFIRKMINSGIERVCVMGSVHEIGFFEGSVNENTPADPKSKYGIAKNALRNLVQLETLQAGIVFQWIRGFYIVGNTPNGCSVFSKIVQAEMRGQESFPFTTGKNQFDFIEYSDFCDQVAAVVEQDEINGIINCCSGFPERIGDRVERFISENGFRIKLDYGAFPERSYDSKAIWGNNDIIKRIMEKKCH